MPLYDPEKACRTFRFPQRIAISKAAWLPMIVGGSRVTMIGISLWGLYLGGYFEAMDTVCPSIPWMALIDECVGGKFEKTLVRYSIW
jgi:hypothetical protein